MYMKNAFGRCDACRNNEEEKFQILKDYIDENKGSMLGEISKETGVSVKRILGYIREGRLVATSGMADDVTCKSCGKPVEKGNFCDACAIKMNNDIKDMYEEKDQQADIKRTGVKMNIQNRL